MKVSFPHMGNAYIPLSALLSNLGAEVITPPRPTSRTIDIGAFHAPEFVCLPFKVNLGDNLRALQMGADTLAMVSGMWACRFGYYGRVQHRILRDAGFEFDSILLGREGLLAVYNKFRGTVDGNLTRAWLHAFRAFKRKAEAMDELESAAREARPFERERGSISRALADGLEMVHRAENLKAIDRALARGLESIRGTELETDLGRPLRVAVLGEIYAVLEPSLNFDIERKLGEMGIMSYPVMSVYKWLFRPLKTDPSILIDERRRASHRAPLRRIRAGGRGAPDHNRNHNRGAQRIRRRHPPLPVHLHAREHLPHYTPAHRVGVRHPHPEPVPRRARFSDRGFDQARGFRRPPQRAPP